MRQRLLVRAAAFACAIALTSTAWAKPNFATVDPAHGVVLVNRGKGFNQIKRPVRLRVGSSVMVGPDGAAVIAYNDGCTVNVKPGSVKSIDPISPCASGAEAQGGPDYTQHDGSWCAAWQNCVFWPAFGATVGFLIYEGISP